MKLNKENQHKLDLYKKQLLEDQKLQTLYAGCTHNWVQCKEEEYGSFGELDIWCFYRCNKCKKESKTTYRNHELYPDA